MKKTFLFVLCTLTMLSATFSCDNKTETVPVEEEKFLPLGFDEDEYKVVEDKVRNGEALTKMMSRLGMSSLDANRLALCCDSVFEVRTLRAGNPFKAYYSCINDTVPDELQYVVYEQNRIRRTIFKCRDSLAVWNYDRPVTHERKFSDVTITSSLWNDMIAAEASPALIVELADIYQWSVNFFTLQQGDRFRVIYNQTVCEDEIISIDTVFFSLFDGGGKQVSALRFQPSDGNKAAYWGKDGESLKRMFLKAPLKYNRISSRFSYHRKHPVTGKVKAHTAVDYAAPKGTPVHAIGDGTVTLCGWDGTGGGNRIKIKHMQGYESCYMHLSKFAKGMKVGKRVSQGELIGYVGATGTATGPHLDFRIWQNKKPIDPLSLNSPASEPLDRKYLEEFNAIYGTFVAEMDSLENHVIPSSSSDQD
ncbi:MAG: peptidoglycan DD-metalloendopeptidase family protein [Bacteroidales bacterium]|nr:peptidoglycan DD-metalloendopeptidase family protein [Candidatus Cacconaster merdequi]